MLLGKQAEGRRWTQTYTYDRFGNRTSVTAGGRDINTAIMTPDGIPTLAYNTANNRITTSGFEYDVAGNQTRALAEDGVTWLRYEYDAANRLNVVRKDDANQTLLQGFQYGSTNARVIDYDAVAGLNKFYAGSGGTVLVEYTEYVQNVPTWTKSYVYFGESQLSTITPNGTGGEYVEYNHPDRLGTRLITNQQTGTVYEQAHLPFGKALNSESTVTNNNKRFTSYDRSAVTGLDYAVNRTYDSKQGRFTQVDPIGMGDSSLVSPQSFNLYTYCQNDPINHTDPGGLGFFSFLKKLLHWIIVALAVIVAIIVIIHAPFTLYGILSAISAGASAGAAVMNALGYPTVSKVLGWIGVRTGGAAGFAAGHHNVSLIIKNFASTAGEILSVWQTILPGLGGVGAISNSFTGKPRKKRPGMFQTVDQAAIWWLKIWNPYSIRKDREVATAICEVIKTGELIVGAITNIGTKTSSQVPKCADGQVRVRSAHTHGNYDEYLESEIFSGDPGDRVNANNRSVEAGGSVPNYLGTPTGAIKKFKPAGIQGSVKGRVITFKSKTETVPGFRW